MLFSAIEIENNDMLDGARAILYRRYINECGWIIENDNPSGLCIDNRSQQKKMLVDDYDKFATWFALRKEQQLIGTLRLCKPDGRGLLELERYAHVRQLLSFLFKDKTALRMVELNREAVLSAYLYDFRPFLVLLKKALKFCLKNNHSIITTCNLPEWQVIYEQIAFPKLPGCSFKYFESEKEPVDVYFATRQDIHRMLENLITYLPKEKIYCYD